MSEFKLSKEKARRVWVEALRSGTYKQGTGILHYKKLNSRCKDRFCCLGVACDLFLKYEGEDLLKVYTEEALHDEDDSPTAFSVERKSYDEHSAALPRKVQEWLGLRSSSGNYHDGSLVDLNDTGTSFKKIANVIENPPDGLLAQA